LRRLLHEVLTDPAHPLRRCRPRPGGVPYFPEAATLPSALRPPDRGSAAALLGAAYATGLAWCRLSGTEVPERGFATAAAVVHRLVHERDDPAPETPHPPGHPSGTHPHTQGTRPHGTPPEGTHPHTQQHFR
ncbi:hypothetical protein ACFOWE_03360, partial [Planomonospora corallina]